ncbi:unnamed protein product [Ascophyllum nodosum]
MGAYHGRRARAAVDASFLKKRRDLQGEEGSRGANSGIIVVSGGADSVVNVWKDITAREEKKAIAEKETALPKEQEMSNCLRDKDYGPPSPSPSSSSDRIASGASLETP